MSRRLNIFLTTLCVPLVLYALYKWNYPTISWNQRMTVEVEVNGEVVSGSSVTRVSYIFYPKTTTEAGSFVKRMRGEAVYVDIGGQPLFALLRSEASVDYTKTLAHALFRNEVPVRMELSQKLRRMVQGLGQRELPRNDYPMLVTFADIDDPTSVQLVDPRDLAATFGEGVSLNRITLAITGDWVTDGIEAVLPWLERPGPSTLSGIRYPSSNSLPNILHNRHFNTE